MLLALRFPACSSCLQAAALRAPCTITVSDEQVDARLEFKLVGKPASDAAKEDTGGAGEAELGTAYLHGSTMHACMHAGILTIVQAFQDHPNSFSNIVEHTTVTFSPLADCRQVIEFTGSSSMASW